MRHRTNRSARGYANRAETAIRSIAPSLLLLSVPACSPNQTWNPTDGLEQAPGGEPVRVASRPAALVDGVPVSRMELFPGLAELAGDQALREYALDRMLSERLRSRGLSVTESMIESERERLTALAGDEMGQEQAVLGPILAERGLGPHRLGSLLERNAGLRLLIADDVTVTDEALDLAYRIRYGEKPVVRVAVFRSPNDAAGALQEIRRRAGDLGQRAAFAEVAAERSLDSSAALGGLIGEVSTLDPGLSAALRTAVRDSAVGEVGPIVALEQAFALVLVDSVTPAQNVPLSQVETALREEVRQRGERLAMDELADELVRQAGVTPIDPALQWSWRRIEGR